MLNRHLVKFSSPYKYKPTIPYPKHGYLKIAENRDVACHSGTVFPLMLKVI